MTPSQAILAGSTMVAVSIFGAALVLPQGAALFGPKAQKADVSAEPAAPD